MKKARKSEHWYNVHDKDVGSFILDGQGDLACYSGLYPDALTNPRMTDACPGSRFRGCR